MRHLSFFTLLLLLMIGGCGYQVPGRDAQWVGGAQRLLHVELFANRTAEPYLDQFLTDAVTRQLAGSRAFAITENRPAADLILGGTATRYHVRAVAYDRRDRIADYRATLETQVRLLEPGSGRTLWHADLQRSENFPAVDDKGRQLELRSQAARRASARLAEDLQAHLLDAF